MQQQRLRQLTAFQVQIQFLQNAQAFLQLAFVQIPGAFLNAFETITVVTEILGQVSRGTAAAMSQHHPVQVDIIGHQRTGNQNGVVLQRQQRVQLLHRRSGPARRHKAHHVKGIGVQRHRSQLAHHFLGHGAIIGQCRQFFHLILQKELVLAASVQQQLVRAGGK